MTFRSAVGRALRLRCPACGVDPIFRGFLAVRPACSACGQSFHPEPGYYVGAMYVNYLTTAAVVITVALLTMDRLDRPVWIVLTAALALVFPLAFHRHARALWLAGDIAISSRPTE